MKTWRIVFLALATLAGCASTPPVEETDGVDSMWASKCEDYDFTRDCSYMWGADRDVTISGLEMRVAGSTSGNFIMIMHPTRDPMAIFSRKSRSVHVNNSYRAVEELLKQKELSVLRTVLIGKTDIIKGYVIEVDGDGYAVLLDAAAKIEEQSDDE
jgi:hypothetical protein